MIQLSTLFIPSSIRSLHNTHSFNTLTPPPSRIPSFLSFLSFLPPSSLGTTMFPGIAERMTKELTALAPSTMKIKVLRRCLCRCLWIKRRFPLNIYQHIFNDDFHVTLVFPHSYQYTLSCTLLRPTFPYLLPHPGGCPPRTQILCMDWWFYLGFFEYFPTDVDLQSRIRRVWSFHRTPKMLLNRCYYSIHKQRRWCDWGWLWELVGEIVWEIVEEGMIGLCGGKEVEVVG